MPQKKANMPQELPYERFLRCGPESLTEAELLAIILRSGTKDNNMLQMAEQVLQLAKSPREGLLGLHKVSLKELKSIRGIGEVKALQLKCIAELAARMRKASAAQGLRFTQSRQVADYFMERLRHKDTECVLVASLDAKGQLLREKQLSEGSVRAALISPREIFLEALDAKAVNILLVHNHPSGDPTPSRDDKELTAAVRELGDKMDIPLLDHIVIGDNRHFSFREHAWCTEESGQIR